MSNPSKYSGLAGTILLGTLLGLNMTQYGRRKNPLSDKAGTFDPESEVSSGSFFDKEGNGVPLGKTDLPGTAFVHRVRDAIPDISPLVLCAALSGLWAVRAFGAMNKVLNRRYSDVVYQIRRPDVIANRVSAWKYLGLGGLVIPAAAIGSIAYATNMWTTVPVGDAAASATMTGFADQSRRLGSLSPLRVERNPLMDSVAEFSRTLRDGFKP